MKSKSKILLPELGPFGMISNTSYYKTSSGSYWTRSEDSAGFGTLSVLKQPSSLAFQHKKTIIDRSSVWNLNSIGHEILETVGGRRLRLDGRKQFNRCFHESVKIVAKDYACYRTYCDGKRYDPRYGFLSNYYQFYGYAPKIADVIPSAFLRKEGLAMPIDLRNMRAKAWYSMQPRFQGNVDLCLFLAESAEFIELIRYFHNLNPLKVVQGLKKIIHDLRKKSNSLRRPSLDLTRPAAEHHLIWNFGILPTISEIMTIVDQLKTVVDEAQKQFADNGANFQSSHYSEKYEDLLEPIANYNPATYTQVFVSGEENYHLYTGTMDYKYAYTLRGHYAAALKFWGLELSYSTIYNGMPFSFLLDYFLTLGRSIRFMEQDNNVKLLDPTYGESFKQLHQKGIFARGYPNPDKSIVPHQLTIIGSDTYDSLDSTRFVAGVVGKRYHRAPVGMATKTFGTIVPEWTHGTSRKQRANMAALARTVLF